MIKQQVVPSVPSVTNFTEQVRTDGTNSEVQTISIPQTGLIQNVTTLEIGFNMDQILWGGGRGNGNE